MLSPAIGLARTGYRVVVTAAHERAEIEAVATEAGIDRVHAREVAIEHDAPGNQELRGISQGAHRQPTVAQEIAEALAAPEPVAVEAGDREHVGHVDLLDEGLRALGELRVQDLERG